MNGREERHLWIWYTPFGMGGVESYLLNMARETCRAGIPFWIAATNSATGPLRELFLKAGAQVLDWGGFHGAFMGNGSGEAMRRRLIDDVARVRPTVLALNDCNDFSIGATPLLRRLRPYCTIVDTFHIDSPLDQYLDFRERFADVLDGIVSTNENVVRHFRERHPELADLPVRYVPNGVTVPDRERTPSDATLRLLYVGRLAQDQKRILELPRLLELLSRRGRPFAMTIVGEGPAREELEAELGRRGLSGLVRLTGYLPPEGVTARYFEHDVLVNLSSFEGFSMSVLEAFAAGCVPVCTDLASLDRDVFHDGVNCRLCPADRLEGMVDIWATLTPETLRELRRAARDTGARYTADRMCAAYRDFFAALRARRPLCAWPADAAPALRLDWDLNDGNPWVARPRSLRTLARSAWTRARHALRR
jgi:glycosyltransferase involved in cell wall biosynthesis